MSRRRKIEALRRLAAGTTYAAEKESALAKAAALEKLEAAERPSGDAASARMDSFFAAYEGNGGIDYETWLKKAQADLYRHRTRRA